MIDGKSVRQYRFAILSSKEKNKLPPKSNLNASNVIIGVLPSTIKRNLQNSVKKSPKRSTVSSIESISTAAKRTMMSAKKLLIMKIMKPHPPTTTQMMTHFGICLKKGVNLDT